MPKPLCGACCVLVIAANTVLPAEERKIRAHLGANSVGVVLASSRVEIQPEQGQGTASSWNYSDLRCARYSKQAEPLPVGWTPFAVATTVGKWFKNLVAKETMDHFVDFVPKIGERVQLRFSDSDVTRVNEQLRAGGVPQCEANVRLANGPEFARIHDAPGAPSDGE